VREHVRDEFAKVGTTPNTAAVPTETSVN
jgi:hypothetical protein